MTTATALPREKKIKMWICQKILVKRLIKLSTLNSQVNQITHLGYTQCPKTHLWQQNSSAYSTFTNGI
ncbi:hypothetical protein JHK85_039510 [Glycine max]|uniref:Uncharacterized protein n=1 Tax=Glycine max TaxID=3847 RepID=A0A0R0G934_SOYBN|nr:hypothetical protein JHK85_039510 [Glycine max]KAH1093005.1 hypothetical protein GYH30_038969 [Glycine max]